LGDPYKENTMKTTSEETEKTETETKTKSETAHHNKEAETVILPSDKELAAKGFFPSGRLWNMGLFQDLDNMHKDPSWSGKTLHLSSNVLKVVGLTTIVGSVCRRSARYLAARAARKAVMQLTHAQVGQAFEAAAQATAFYIE